MAAPLLRCTKQEEAIKCEFVNSVIHDILMNTHANDVSIVTVTVIVSFFCQCIINSRKKRTYGRTRTTDYWPSIVVGLNELLPIYRTGYCYTLPVL